MSLQSLGLEILVLWAALGGVVLILLSWAMHEIRRARRFWMRMTAIQVLALTDPARATKLLTELMAGHK